jgi:hypothetical protein
MSPLTTELIVKMQPRWSVLLAEFWRKNFFFLNVATITLSLPIANEAYWLRVNLVTL